MALHMCGFRTRDESFWDAVQEHKERFPEIQPFLPRKIRKEETKKECLNQMGCPMINCRDCKIPEHLKKYQWGQFASQEIRLIRFPRLIITDEDVLLWKKRKDI